MKTLKITLLFALSLILVNCGDDKKKEEKETVKIGSNSSSTSKKSDENVTEVVLLATDMMQFDKNEIRVPAGKKVKLTLRHTGKQAVEVMGHNFVLLTQGTEIPAFGAKASAARDNAYIPQDTDAVIVHTKMLGGGQSDTIEFDPPAPGTYDFICSFPGHYSVMKGKFIVE
ncbi:MULTISPECIES: plastocyanin/azurin family copper-binding protein [Leeuwenhoekiella]|uniref:Azurin n=1 Tax=Leeuwenhoekiella palythoae TaxID=573501 RepID=A0A1M5W6K6_9FLAO|nr:MULTISPECIES: azurin [Leeuwenhoekiella]MAS20887.1 azurin [Leeuwenhoekiella sp.]RXG31225.1 azurin [Leeuwenhoekiella palythoae]UBZ12009.1 azurin [Leeuwenhoekiella palythoae]SHH83068.1 azurin [Leeuwenhoekiella palythoae]HAX15242.1 azurin [Leeuwenhoekiella sp.]|tara:strand:+ start:1047 stop:1559 length:513 start_codon:yes stop_codon:yes gene_type:complete